MPIDKTIEDTAEKIAKALLIVQEQRQAAINQATNDAKMAEMMKTAISDALKENGLSQDQAEVLEEAVEEKLEEQEEARSVEEGVELDETPTVTTRDRRSMTNGEVLNQEKEAGKTEHSQAQGMDTPGNSTSTGGLAAK